MIDVKNCRISLCRLDSREASQGEIARLKKEPDEAPASLAKAKENKAVFTP
jgi:hypothetical protein